MREREMLAVVEARLGVAVVLHGAKSGDPQKQLRSRLEKNARLYRSLYRA